jgi:hypothetical protein
MFPGKLLKRTKPNINQIYKCSKIMCPMIILLSIYLTTSISEENEVKMKIEEKS